MAATRSTVPMGTAVSIASWEPLAPSKACTANRCLEADPLRDESPCHTRIEREGVQSQPPAGSPSLQPKSVRRALHGSKQLLQKDILH